MKNRKQAEKTSQDKGALSAFLFPENTDNGESCVMCGTAVPEGRQVCPACQAKHGKPLVGKVYTRKVNISK